MALSANTPRAYDTAGPVTDNEQPVKASAVIYEGAVVGMTAGYARGLVAGDVLAGLALAKATGTSADAGVNVNVRSAGRVQVSITNLAVTDIGADVYASDDGTFTLTAGGNTFFGKVHRWVSTGIGIVAFNSSATA